ncbi:unnamed protein product [Coregonus sp. 'balchen']|nr:unnamed protein product [Coregonus sp. 'balchen']
MASTRHSAIPNPNIPPVIVKEWSSGKSKSALTPELVPALCFREWTCPNLRRLWLGRASEDRSRRTRAFLACLRSDCPALLNPAQVPQHLLLMCCVLRYMMQWPGGRILQRHELDAFLAQAVSNQLYEPDQLQELKAQTTSPLVPCPATSVAIHWTGLALHPAWKTFHQYHRVGSSPSLEDFPSVPQGWLFTQPGRLSISTTGWFLGWGAAQRKQDLLGKAVPGKECTFLKLLNTLQVKDSPPLTAPLDPMVWVMEEDRTCTFL